MTLSFASDRFRLRLFLVLSAIDLLMTMWLLHHPSEAVYEANPVAAWVLARQGWLGMVVYKAIAVVLAVSLLVITARFRPHVADRLLTFSCVALLAVVSYSAVLAVGLENPHTREHVAELGREKAKAQELEATSLPSRSYYRFVAEVYGDVANERITLAEGARRWLNEPHDRAPEWLRSLQTREAPQDAEKQVAARLLADLLVDVTLHPARIRLLEEQFLTSYGMTPGPMDLDHQGWLSQGD